MKGKLVVVRGSRSGVHVGFIKKRNGSEVTLRDSRILWRWRGANTLMEVAQYGISMDWSRVSQPAKRAVVLDAIEIIRVSDEAKESLTNSRWPA